MTRRHLSSTLLASGSFLLGGAAPVDLLAKDDWDGYGGVGDYATSNGKHDGAMNLGLYTCVQHTSRLTNRWVRPVFGETLEKIAESPHGNGRHPQRGRKERRPSRSRQATALNLGKD